MPLFGDEWTSRITLHIYLAAPSNARGFISQSPIRAVKGADRGRSSMTWAPNVSSPKTTAAIPRVALSFTDPPRRSPLLPQTIIEVSIVLQGTVNGD
jgi:hypothetical protein